MPVPSRAARQWAFVLALILAVTASLAAGPVPAAAATLPPKVAVIVGPVGPDMTPRYIDRAEEVARQAAAAGARVAKAYSPRANPANVLRAVQGANVVVYFGHGNGYPNPYTSTLDPNKVNGWGLQGPNAKGTHADSWSDGTLKYYGEAWIRANARPAPGFVMIYAQACYAAGSSEPHLAPSTWKQAKARAGYYSRTKVGAMKGRAYFATNHGDAGALVGRLLNDRSATYGRHFRAGRGYDPDTMRKYAHPYSSGDALWLSPRKRSDGKLDFAYAFAGTPTARPSSWKIVADATAPRVVKRSPGNGATGIGLKRTIRVVFDESVRGVSTSTFVLKSPAGKTIAATVTYDPATLTASLKAARDLAPNRTYTVILTGGIRNLDGLRLPRSEWQFKTRP